MCRTSSSRIKIQSISDIITNSSSEVFCRIEDKDLEEVYDILLYFFKPDGNSEYEPCISFCNKEEIDDLEDYSEYADKWIEVELPYSYNEVEDIYRHIIDLITSDYFPNSKVTYEY